MEISQSFNSTESFPKGLSELHQESINWLSAIEFWKTEFNFFRNLINKNFLRVTLVDKMQGLDELDKRLDHICAHDLAPLEIEIKKHEHYLNKLESGDSDVDDVTYRNIHKEAAHEIQRFEKIFNKFKSDLFYCLEHVCD